MISITFAIYQKNGFGSLARNDFSTTYIYKASKGISTLQLFTTTRQPD